MHPAAVRREKDGHGESTEQKAESGNGEDGGTRLRVASARQEAETFTVKLLRQVLDSTVELDAAIERFLKGQAVANRELEGSLSPPKRRQTNAKGSPPSAVLLSRTGPPSAIPLWRTGYRGMQNAEYVFRWTGRDWKVVCAGDKGFYLEDMLAAKWRITAPLAP